MTYRKKLIEVALPLEAINEASAQEKYIRNGHPSTLHLWWARRPLAAARAVIFASLVDDPDSPDALPTFVEACKKLPIGANVKANGDTPRMRLFDFIERLVTWEATTDEAILSTARELIQIATEGNPPPLLDPFAGGGSIPLEAQRLGLEAHASDLNPVAVMINKAQIEIPPRFAHQPPVNPRDRQRMNSGEGWKGTAGLAADVRFYGEWMRERAWERIGHLYPTYNGETVIAWIWARTVKSPNPAVDVHVPLVGSFALSTKRGQRVWIEPEVRDKKISYNIVTANQGNPPNGTTDRLGGRCLISNAPIPFEYIRSEGKAGRIGTQLMTIVTEKAGEKHYYAPTYEHESAATIDAPPDAPDTDLPEQALGFRVQLYGLTRHADLFSPRQLWMLVTLCNLIPEVFQQIIKEVDNWEYARAIAMYLAFAIGRYSDYGSAMAYWDDRSPLIQKTFGLPTLQMRWGFPEANPFAGFSGSWLKMVDSVATNLEFLPVNALPGIAIQQPAQAIGDNLLGQVISTDPPYYDNIGYAALSDYFYVWMRKAIGDLFPDLFGTLLTPKSQELIAEPARHKSKSDAARFFEQTLFQVFDRFYALTKPDYPISIFYAFKQQESGTEQITSTGWEVFLAGLIRSGFHIGGTWPIRTEQPGGLRLAGRNSLASSIVLVCRPRPENAPTISRRQFVDALRRELPAALKEMQSGNIAPVDLAQASIGPGMAIYSRYSKVLEADGSPMSVRTALGLINQELDAYLAEQDGDIDPDTRFAVSWFEQFGFNEGEFGQADVLARAKNTSVAGVEAANIVAAGRGKVRLLHWKEYDPGIWDPRQDKRPTVWEATHHLIERLNNHGETGSAMLMTKMPHDMAAEARNLAYRLYSICERKGWADHARDYNALVISWAGIGEETARLREAAESGQATRQMGLFGEE
jgi:putative DNA methylase